MNFDHTRMETLVRDVLNAASAPPNSRLWASVPERTMTVWTDGDPQDAWVFTSTMLRVVVDSMGVRQMLCEHPDHHPKHITAFVPFDDKGQPKDGMTYIGPIEDAPEHMKLHHRDVLLASEMMNAEILQDPIRSQEAWNAALKLGVWKEIVGIAVRQAGDWRRRIVRGEN